jgi:hypothetical protein
MVESVCVLEFPVPVPIDRLDGIGQSRIEMLTIIDVVLLNMKSVASTGRWPIASS